MRLHFLISSVISGAFLLLTNTVCLAQQAPESPTTNAATLYTQGKFQEALGALQQNGLKSASDYYNAANCYFRLGKLGVALSHYEKAHALAPSNDDITYNLRLTEQTLEKTGGVAKDQSLWRGRLVPYLRRFPEAFADLLLGLVTLGLAVVAYRSKKEKVKFNQALVQPSFLVVLALWAATGLVTIAIASAQNMKLGAVIHDVAVARSGPSETFTELFKLPAGSKVEVTGESREGWLQVRFSVGNIGWILDKDLLQL